ncbi:hypothetical protein SPB21_11250 [Leptothoe sp. ISB3NOV94-8A]
MGPLSKYWVILRIDPGGEGRGYKEQVLPLASEFFQAELADLFESAVPADRSVRTSASVQVLADAPVQVRSQPLVQKHRTIQTLLHRQFTTQSSAVSLQNRAKAGLCLRGYVSYAIVAECKVLASKFAATGQLSHKDLLPYVLDDDGEIQIVLDQDPKHQLVLNGSGKPQPSAYQRFSVEALRKFNPNGQRVASLDNWIHLQVRQNQDLKTVLSERGFYKLTDWALLNRARQPQLESFSPHQRHIINAFHAVYRRDRRQQRHNHKSCPAPTPTQLNEMQQQLQAQGITINLSKLITELRQIAQTLRQYAIWSKNGAPQSESLEAADPYSGLQREFCDPHSTNDLDHIAQQELREFCAQQLIECLDWAINQGIREHIQSLHQRPRYTIFASKVTAILKLVYCQGQSQSKVADLLGMKNQSQVSRVLNPTTLLNRVRYWTVDHFFKVLSTKVSSLNLAALSTDPDYLQNLMQHIEAFVDAEAFQVAIAEIKTAKNRSMNSLYAQRLRHYLEN